MIGYCFGLRLDINYMEQKCQHRDVCPYYTNVNLGVALSHPDEYQELDTYNNNNCKYYDIQWQKKWVN